MYHAEVSACNFFVMAKRRSIFKTVQTPRVPRNKFDLSHDVKFTAKMGKLIPVLCQEMVPGDSFRVQSDMLVRMMPMSSPAFGNLRAYVHYFFVPNRLLNDNWEDMITGGEDGIPKYFPPYFELGDFLTYFAKSSSAGSSTLIGTLWDYFGLPVPTAENWHTQTYSNKTPISFFPFLAYWLIWYEYYRDQNVSSGNSLIFENLIDSCKALSGKSEADANLSTIVTTLLNRCYLKDYFTSALPTPQRGPEVVLPIGGSVDIQADGPMTFQANSTGTQANIGDPIGLSDNNLGAIRLKSFEANPDLTDLPTSSELTYLSGLDVGLDSQTALTINDLRRSIALQNFYEISARSGSRYIEQIYGHFHVRSSDARLQRPEYLGGGICPINIGEVLQTGETTETSPQGNMAGRGIGFGRSNKARFFAEEHGYLMGILSIVPEAIYYQGVDKSWSRISRDDYYWPSFANLGEQPIEKQELYALGTDDNYGQLFGYTPRYAEYKFSRNRLAGLMRTSLANWTFARELSAANLNESFLEIPQINNPFAVQDDTDKFIIQMYHKIDAVRPMPYFGNPATIL